ncbi:hypothetical protein MRB53_007999 [Persea americana]|uniref:Uncharacterized protein n=1 Tax=Persea americana TaxID=3435 RepID=A0ACC2MLF9_PERAE|nr:hypothetical protein MRB53_007999 [Persea americana]
MYEVGEIPMESREAVRDKQNSQMTLERSLTLGDALLLLLGFQKLEQKVNMIITDYCIPEMTGFDLLKRVKESSTLREIPMVVMSSENIPTRINRIGVLGATFEVKS